MSTPPRAVFDCNVFFQALIGQHGPAAACLECVKQGRIELVCSEYVIAELLDVCSRPAILGRFRFAVSGVGSLVQVIRSTATFPRSVPPVYVLAADSKDSHYIDLAVAANAALVVSRDRDLLRLMEVSHREAKDFRARFPHLLITDPPGMLRWLASTTELG